jgi:hypothetical protein
VEKPMGKIGKKHMKYGNDNFSLKRFVYGIKLKDV